VDLHAALAGPDGFLPIALGEDGIHLTPAGYQRWAALLAEVLGDPSQPAP